VRTRTLLAAAVGISIAATAVIPSATAQVIAPVGVVPAAVVNHVPPLIGGTVWHPSNVRVKGRHVVYHTLIKNGAVALMWIDASLLKFRLIPGPMEPEGSPMRAIDRRPSTWVPHMAAAFNGGFRLGDGVGGYFYNGTTVQRMRNGYAALVVTKTGQLKVQVWGRDLKTTAGAMSIRQNLPPLVWKGKAMTKATDNEATWGEADKGLWKAIRSAAGVLADGSVVYAYGYNVRPSVMAAAMVAAHVQTAVMLDMNQSWPMGFYYDAPVRGNQPVGHRVHPGVYREPDSYYYQFKKDFVVALTP